MHTRNFASCTISCEVNILSPCFQHLFPLCPHPTPYPGNPHTLQAIPDRWRLRLRAPTDPASPSPPSPGPSRPGGAVARKSMVAITKCPPFRRLLDKKGLSSVDSCVNALNVSLYRVFCARNICIPKNFIRSTDAGCVYVLRDDFFRLIASRFILMLKTCF